MLLDVKDQGTDSINNVEGVEVMDVETWDDLETTYWWLVKNPGKFKTLVIDTVTQLQQICVEHVLASKKKNTTNAGDWGTMTKREWGDVAQLMKTWIVNLRDLPMEVVFLAQDRVFNIDDDVGGSEEMLMPEVGPRLSPSVAGTLNAAVSVIGATFVLRKVVKKEGKKDRDKFVHCLRIGPNSVFTTKCRKPVEILLPDYIEDPQYQDIVDIINGEY